ncbi:MAG: hypothetical protein PUP46_02500 [Endozoicomonas sp. (ex Botrylloides leachii)]|nr:hypothetical protein [Endozoicomonas sp. (ex Botrylloides leachii)]
MLLWIASANITVNYPNVFTLSALIPMVLSNYHNEHGSRTLEQGGMTSNSRAIARSSTTVLVLV